MSGSEPLTPRFLWFENFCWLIFHISFVVFLIGFTLVQGDATAPESIENHIVRGIDGGASLVMIFSFWFIFPAAMIVADPTMKKRWNLLYQLEKPFSQKQRRDSSA